MREQKDLQYWEINPRSFFIFLEHVHYCGCLLSYDGLSITVLTLQ